MKPAIRKAFIAILSMAALAACKKNAPMEPVTYNYNYFPLHQGFTAVYSVDTLYYDPIYNNGRKSVSHEVKIVVDTSFIDGAGEEAWRIFTYIAIDSPGYWKPSQVWQAKRIDNRLELVQDNLRFIKLVFPPDLNKEWRGNIYIDPTEAAYRPYENWEYRVITAYEPAVVNNQTFDSTITVQETVKFSVIDSVDSRAIYAAGKGMISFDQTILRYETNGNIQPGPLKDKATHGFITSWRIRQ